MKVARNTVVEFHYTLRDDQGETLETTHGEDPTAVLVGHQNVIRGVEEALDGKAAGDTISVEVPPEKGYGEIRDDWTQRVSKKYFAKPKLLRPGSVQRINTDKGERSVTVIKVGSKVVDVDLNHPMAGKTLHFEIELLDVRAASPEEVSHGHAHGKHGAHH